MARLTAALIVLLAVWFGGTATAQTPDKLLLLQAPCSPFPVMIETAKKYGEKPLFIGRGMTFSAGKGQPYTGGMFFTVNQDSEKRNWTLFQVFADGMTCMIFNGNQFEPYWEK